MTPRLSTRTSPPAALRVDAATKRFGDVVAVDDVSLEVAPGQVQALLGLNGAGKTTLIRMLLGMVVPTAGRVEVAGRVLPDRSVWAEVGYLVETPASYPELTVRENLEVVRRLRRVDSPAAVDAAIERFALGAYADRRTRDLSLGNNQRLGLAKALLHRPRLLVLDEPVNGLDPAGVVEVRDLLVDLAHRHGTTVLLSSHLLAEVARAADRIAVMHEGRLVEEFPAAELGARVHRRLEVGSPDLDRARAVLKARGVVATRSGAVLRVDEPDVVARPEDVAGWLAEDAVPLSRLAVVEEDLETYFLRLVRPGPVDVAPSTPDLEVSRAH